MFSLRKSLSWMIVFVVTTACKPASDADTSSGRPGQMNAEVTTWTRHVEMDPENGGSTFEMGMLSARSECALAGNKREEAVRICNNSKMDIGKKKCIQGLGDQATIKRVKDSQNRLMDRLNDVCKKHHIENCVKSAKITSDLQTSTKTTTRRNQNDFEVSVPVTTLVCVLKATGSR